jgi:hypothetical protein
MTVLDELAMMPLASKAQATMSHAQSADQARPVWLWRQTTKYRRCREEVNDQAVLCCWTAFVGDDRPTANATVIAVRTSTQKRQVVPPSEARAALMIGSSCS